MDTLTSAFANLDRWRHFPAYQLERRADIFFSVYLPEVLSKYTSVEIEQHVIPEFPLKRDLIWPDSPMSKSVKVDYVLFSKDKSKAFFVELKTDCGSRCKRQDDYLKIAQSVGLQKLVTGVTQIVMRTTAFEKYYHLLYALEKLELLRLPPQLQKHLFPKRRPGLERLLKEIAVKPNNYSIEVVYVQPVSDPDSNCIDFKFFARCLENRTDPLTVLFREHLVKWCEPAGQTVPQ